jgi:DNA modification methylase
MILLGDCRDAMRGLIDHGAQFDSIVTDPPYELGFMGKGWDKSGVAYEVEVWRMARDLLKPGGHLLAFGGSRTYHRLACAIEDAGFEVRDQIMWLYGSGFPKSRDVSKAIDAGAGAEREVISIERTRFKVDQAREEFSSWKSGSGNGDSRTRDNDGYRFDVKTAPATDAARQWDGWGTALKPAHEPLVLARKPLHGTVAANVLEHGTGALNIDGCKVPGEFKSGWSDAPGNKSSGGILNITDEQKEAKPDSINGRWPANVIHDGSEEVEAAFAAFGERQARGGGAKRRSQVQGVCYDAPKGGQEKVVRNDTGTASRFFYCAKASKADRDDGLDDLPLVKSTVGDVRPCGDFNERLGKSPTIKRNVHPTVKPTALMRYLCRLITPPDGRVFDPFAGSGSTGRGAVMEGFRFMGVEIDPEYADIAKRRIRAAMKRATMQDRGSGACKPPALAGGS